MLHGKWLNHKNLAIFWLVHLHIYSLHYCHKRY